LLLYHHEVWNPVTEQFGALAPIYGTMGDLIHRHGERPCPSA
jgi:ABC-type phosphate transport system permease subunit